MTTRIAHGYLGHTASGVAGLLLVMVSLCAGEQTALD